MLKKKYYIDVKQSGIYAGEEGFDIYVGSNTDLKGGVIASEAEAEKNKLSTGTLTWEDIKNKAEYEADSKGIAIDTRKSAEKTEAGLTPNIGMPAADEAESTTKAAIADGTIEIRDKENQKQDVSQLNRDTQNSLNKLGEIFDKTKIEERQELAGLFGELAYKAVGDLAIKNGWAEGSAEKNALHALIGGIMSELGGSGFLAGASGALVNEMIQDKLSDMFKDDPAMHQWASALIGGVVSEIVANNAQAGASTAASGTKNNRLSHDDYLEYLRKIKEAAERGDKGSIIEIISEYQGKDLQNEKELVDRINNDPEFVNGLLEALKENPDLEVYDGVVIKGFSVTGDITGKNVLQEYVGKLSSGEEVLIHSEHPLYNSQTKATNFVNDFIESHNSELANFNKEVIKAYGIASVDTIIKRLPESLEVGKESYNVNVNGKALLKGVSLGGVVTTASGVYEIYVDSKKYSGKDLVLATAIDVAAVGVSFAVGNFVDSTSKGQLGYLLPLVNGGTAYLINKGVDVTKEKILNNQK